MSQITLPPDTGWVRTRYLSLTEVPSNSETIQVGEKVALYFFETEHSLAWQAGKRVIYKSYNVVAFSGIT